MFLDQLTKEVAQHFGIGANAGPAINALLTHIATDYSGGYRGLIEDLQARGYDEMVRSWIGYGPNQAISEETIFDLFGANWLESAGDQCGIHRDTFAEICAFALPQIIDQLSINADIPASIPAWATGYFTSTHTHTAKPVDTTKKPVVRPRSEPVRRREPMPTHAVVEIDSNELPVTSPETRIAARPVKSGSDFWLIARTPLVLATIVGLVGYFSVSRPNRAPVASPSSVASTNGSTPEPRETAVASATATSALEPSALTLMNKRGEISFTGIVKETNDKERLQKILTDTGAKRGDLEVDMGVGDQKWSKYLRAIIADYLKPGLELQFVGNTLMIVGEMPQSDFESLQNLVAEDMTVVVYDPEEVARTNNSRAYEALDRLVRKKETTPAQLIAGLNLQTINFKVGSAEIPDFNRKILSLAAESMDYVKPRSTLVVIGHSDSTGNPESNRALSLKRAQAVVDFLKRLGVEDSEIRAEGMGADKPIASNETEYGRFQNRRIEFDVESSSPAKSE